MKSGSNLREKLTKQNEISQQMLARELSKLERVEKSDLRMLETARLRFLSRYRKLSDANEPPARALDDVRMYETHTPGFCYHRTGVMKNRNRAPKKVPSTNTYDLVRSLLFTDDTLDPDKVLCLHILAAHSASSNKEDEFAINYSHVQDKEKSQQLTGAWNTTLPCYVILHRKERSIENVKLHEDPRATRLEDQALRGFEQRYQQYIEKDADYELAIAKNANKNRAPNTVGMLPIIPPHVYSLLGASHELKVKQAEAEKPWNQRFMRSGSKVACWDTMDDRSMSIRFDRADLFSKCTMDSPTVNGSARTMSKLSHFGGTRGIDRGITTLRPKFKRTFGNAPSTVTRLTEREEAVVSREEFLTEARKISSNTSSLNWRFRDVLDYLPSAESSYIGIGGPLCDSKVTKCKRYLYLNAPLECSALKRRRYRIVPILVNYRVQALIHAILEVLERANPEKSKRIIEIARNPEEINKILLRTELQSFIDTLKGQPLISSADSYVVSYATLVDEIDPRFEKILERELVALALEIPAMVQLEELVEEIKENLFRDTRKESKVESSTLLSNLRRSTTRSTGNTISEEHSPTVLSKTNVAKLNNFSPSNVEWRGKNKQVPGTKLKTARVNDAIKNLGIRDPSIENDNTTFTKLKNMHRRRQSKGRIATEPPAATTTLDSEEDWQDERRGSAESDRVILRRMTNAQRILVGQMCASIKSKKINNEGLIEDRMPLAALITPALSRDAIKALTRGTLYSEITSSSRSSEKNEEYKTDKSVETNIVTGPVLAKICQEVVANETKERLKSFLKA